MRLALIGDFVAVPHKSGKRRNVGNWSFVDSTNDAFGVRRTPEAVRLWNLSPLNRSFFGEIRSVYHYGTLMGSFILGKDEKTWEFTPISVGWGSASDQQGMNKILANYGWKYRRNNGDARYEVIGDKVTLRFSDVDSRFDR
jgi:hypothetical protein